MTDHAAEQVIADALDGYLDAELTRELAAESVADDLRERGLLLGPDSERIREAEQVIADAFDGWQPAPPYGATAARIAGRLRAKGHLLGPDKVAVDRNVLRAALIEDGATTNLGAYNARMRQLKARDALLAALSEPQPKPEGTS